MFKEDVALKVWVWVRVNDVFDLFEYKLLFMYLGKMVLQNS